MAIDSKKYTVVLGSLYALNGLLPQDYRVEIDDETYKDRTRTNIFATCSNPECKKEIDYNTIVIQTVHTTPEEELITGSTTHQVWYCPACDYENLLLETKMIKTVLKEPYFLKVVPAPPKMGIGGLDRRTFERKFESWAWTLLDELEERMAQYRDDNWERGGGEMQQGAELETVPEEEITP